MLVAELFFGRDGIDQAAWDGYVADTLTAAFPDGLTVLDGYGQWRDPGTGKIAREPSTEVVIAAADAPASHAGLDRVIRAYEARFHQKSVGLLLDRRCGAF